MALALPSLKPRRLVAYSTSVEYSTAKPRVAKIWIKNSAPAPGGMAWRCGAAVVESDGVKMNLYCIII
ncbi:hypothetical protein D3C71_1444150 [compost metagenome]